MGEQVEEDWRSGSRRPLPVRRPMVAGGYGHRLMHGQRLEPEELAAGQARGTALRRDKRWAA
ncbi:hypothetical protein [Streptomyces sp. DT171]|uniref:hypothetical protein n=1 Tax=Streptomyces sp. DT171 TaxID=3416524 RepID=UPI003CF15F1F